MVTKEQLARINELAKKAKTAGLSQKEKEEQTALRKLYIKSLKDNMVSILDNTSMQYPDGSKKKLVRTPKKDSLEQ